MMFSYSVIHKDTGREGTMVSSAYFHEGDFYALVVYSDDHSLATVKASDLQMVHHSQEEEEEVRGKVMSLVPDNDTTH